MIQDDTFIAEGVLEDEIKVPCSRCLETVIVDQQITFRDLYLKRKSDMEKFEKDFPGNIFYVDQGFINLDDSMGAALEEIRSEKPICSEKCKGLCPSCGKNLNKVKCACKEDDIDPRLEALKNFKI